MEVHHFKPGDLIIDKKENGRSGIVWKVDERRSLIEIQWYTVGGGVSTERQKLPREWIRKMVLKGHYEYKQKKNN